MCNSANITLMLTPCCIGDDLQVINIYETEDVIRARYPITDE